MDFWDNFANGNGDDEGRTALPVDHPSEDAGFDHRSIEKSVRAVSEFGMQSLMFVPIGTILRAITAVLKTEVAQVTLAQVFDGLPLAAVLRESRDDDLQDQNHPIYQHTTPSAEALAKVSCLWKLYEPSVWRDEGTKQLRFDNELLRAFKRALSYSPDSATYLFEIVVVAIHQIAVSLFQSRPQNKETDAIISWTAPKENSTWWQHNRAGAPPTLLRHSQYTDYDQYPEGIADVVGYWAEGRIFGGVLLRDYNIYPGSKTIFLHPDRDNGPCQIFGVLNEQLMDVYCYLTEKKPRPRAWTESELAEWDPISHARDRILNPDFPTQPGALEALGLSSMASNLDEIKRCLQMIDPSACFDQDGESQIVPDVSALQLSSTVGPPTTSGGAVPQPDSACPLPILPSNNNPCRMNLSRPTNFITCYREHWKDDEERLVCNFARWISLEEFLFPKEDAKPNNASLEHQTSSPDVRMNSPLIPSDLFEESPATHQAET